jgi:hypothetical protein
MIILKILEIAPSFQETKDIILRHETLDTNLRDVLRIKKENEHRLKAQKKELKQFSNVRFFLAYIDIFGCFKCFLYFNLII